MVGAPILHVNADDPDAVVQACIIAADWRAYFKRDIVIDIVGYRRSATHLPTASPDSLLLLLIVHHVSCVFMLAVTPHEFIIIEEGVEK